MHPVIGITCDTGKNSNGEELFFLKKKYTDAVSLSGGVPLLLPPVSTPGIFNKLKTEIDGLLISGGDFDIPPKHYEEKNGKNLGNIIHERTDFELSMLAFADKKGLPILGICGGHQLINVYYGGSLYQDIPTDFPTRIDHSPGHSSLSHSVSLNTDSLLYKILGRKETAVNSTHHQAIKKIAPGFKASAVSEDGLTEAIESENANFIIGVQWHPEGLAEEVPVFRKLFDKFIHEAKKNLTEQLD